MMGGFRQGMILSVPTSKFERTHLQIWANIVRVVATYSSTSTSTISSHLDFPLLDCLKYYWMLLKIKQELQILIAWNF